MGDFNEIAMDPNLLDLQSWHNLCNLFSNKHPHQQVNTYQMGLDHIDQILVSAPLLPQITQVGYKPISVGIPSDHCGMYLDIKGTALSNRTLAPCRKLRANHYTYVKTYQSKSLNYLKKEKIIPRI